MKNYIIIKNARENNLKNISLSIPRDKLIVVTGLSGSGKSSLVFDTIFNEGQRRYVESLSPYARQFLGGLKKPEVDSIDGLSPAISIDQRAGGHSPRSIVATMTEIYDYLRLVWARIGIPICPKDGTKIEAQSIKTIVDEILKKNKGLIRILSPVIKQTKGEYQELFSTLRSDGFTRVIINGKLYNLRDIQKVQKTKRHDISIYIDLIALDDKTYDLRSRVYEAIEQAVKYARGNVVVEELDENNKLKKRDIYSQRYMCPKCGFSVPDLTPNFFSFNSPSGACTECKGIGVSMEVDLAKLIPDDNLSIDEGGIAYFKNTMYTTSYDWAIFYEVIKYYNISTTIPIKKIPKKLLHALLYETPDRVAYSITSSGGNVYKKTEYIEGIASKIRRRYFETSSSSSRENYNKYMSEYLCRECKGERLNKEALSVKVGGISIIDFIKKDIREIQKWLKNLKLTKEELTIVKMAMDEIESRIHFLVNVGLSYLTLDRSAATLSGGESQRIRLATQIGSLLTGVIYVLDEPSIGLHQKDNMKLIEALQKMRNNGNTVIVVEHDEETIMSADWIIDMGPGAGIQGGEIIAEGEVDDIIKNKNSLTGQYLSGIKKIETPKKRRKGNGKQIKIIGASENNLKKINVSVPLGKLICVTGVSGSGKSTLVSDIIHNGIFNAIHPIKWHHRVGKFKKIEGTKYIDKVVNINQSPIGRTSRSTPATYTKVFDEIRKVFGNTKEAILRGYTPSRFSFNTAIGRCEKCQGQGKIIIPMHFLPDVSIVCDECEGKRYNEETLQVRYRKKTIADVLNMTVFEAIDFFKNHPKILHILNILNDVGLSYISLGHSATILSGGEAQRIKLVHHLKSKPTGKTLYILDEPTTGLHLDDVKKLISVLNRLVNHGDTVIVIEHNLELIKVADYIIDLGPSGGDEGGEVIATGTPEEVTKIKQSYTGYFLKKYLSN